jgi:hypothetical protein
VRRALCALALLLWLVPTSAAAQAADFDVPNGHFFSQTGGFAVTDDGGVRFWSEMQRVGGVAAVGYPVSRRFQWDGFTVQAFQRVVFQWRADQNAVAFVNVFDRLHDLGKDEFLLKVRQTPPPRAFADGGKPFDQVAREHLAVLDAYPAIKAKFFAAVGDPVQANGLPVSDVTDMGNAFVLRAQRVVLQQWKHDVPWARAGEVTVALGGDIAKEAGILPDPAALQPQDAGVAAQPPATTQGYMPWVQGAIAELQTTGKRLQELGSQPVGPADFAPNAPYRVRFETELNAWRRLYQEAQLQTPPPQLQAFHADFLAALQELDVGAQLFLAGINEANAAKIQSALPHVQKFAQLMNQAALKLRSTPPV